MLNTAQPAASPPDTPDEFVERLAQLGPHRRSRRWQARGPLSPPAALKTPDPFNMSDAAPSRNHLENPQLRAVYGMLPMAAQSIESCPLGEKRGRIEPTVMETPTSASPSPNRRETRGRSSNGR